METEGEETPVAPILSEMISFHTFMHPIFLRYTSVMSCHIHLELPRLLFPSGFSINTSHAPISHSCCMPTHFIRPGIMTRHIQFCSPSLAPYTSVIRASCCVCSFIRCFRVGAKDGCPPVRIRATFCGHIFEILYVGFLLHFRYWPVPQKVKTLYMETRSVAVICFENQEKLRSV